MSGEVTVVGPGVAPPANDGRAHRSHWYARANAVVVGYLAAALLVIPVHAGGSTPRWLVIHLFVLGAVTNAILIWSRYFAVTLLHVPDPTPKAMTRQLLIVNVGVLSVLRGVTAGSRIITVFGAVVLAAAIGVHLLFLIRSTRTALGGRFTGLVSYYTAAAVALLVGIGLGTTLAVGAPAGWQGRLYAAHVHVNLLGWVSLTVLGTEFTLWPTVLRTRMVDGVRVAARRGLLLTTTGLSLTIVGLLGAGRPVTAVGLVVYTAGTLFTLDPFVRTALRKPPRSPAAWMLAAGTSWLVVALAIDLAAVLSEAGSARAVRSLAGLVPVLLTGFIAQVLMGALTYLLPVVLGRGPVGNRRLAAVLDRLGRPRLAVLNIGVALIALPLPAAATKVGWALALAALAGFLGLVTTALAMTRTTPSPPVPPAGAHRRSPLGGTAVGVVVMLAGLGIALSGQGTPPSHGSTFRLVQQGVPVPVTFARIDIAPETIDVLPGTRLVLAVTNRDSTGHDVSFPGGPRTRLLEPGESEKLDLGVMTKSFTGWCTVPGHREAGMTLTVRVTKTP